MGIQQYLFAEIAKQEAAKKQVTKDLLSVKNFERGLVTGRALGFNDVQLLTMALYTPTHHQDEAFDEDGNMLFSEVTINNVLFSVKCHGVNSYDSGFYIEVLRMPTPIKFTTPMFFHVCDYKDDCQTFAELKLYSKIKAFINDNYQTFKDILNPESCK